MKKPFNPDTLANELQDTAFFRRTDPKPSPRETEESIKKPTEPMQDHRTPERSITRTEARTVERPTDPPPARRRARRYSFEIYEDQIDRVKRLALEDQLSGGTLNQSEIVRKAIDQYLATLEEKGE